MSGRTPGAAALHAASPIAEPLYAIRLDTHTLRLALNCQEAAELAGMTERELWGAINRGELAAMRGGRRYRITVQALLTYLGLLGTEQHRMTA